MDHPRQEPGREEAGHWPGSDHRRSHDIQGRNPPAKSAAASAAPMVLVGTADLHLARRIRATLGDGGFDTTLAEDGGTAVRAAAATPPQMILLDWALPPVSGLAVCRRLRRIADIDNIPVVVLTPGGGAEFRIQAMESGADGCIAASHPVPALVDRVRAMLRRTDTVLPSESRFRLGSLELDYVGHRVWRNGQVVAVRPTEFQLLRILMTSPDRVFSRGELVKAVWPDRARVSPRTVDVQMARLRRALNVDTGPDPIRTVRTVGYAISA